MILLSIYCWLIVGYFGWLYRIYYIIKRDIEVSDFFNCIVLSICGGIIWYINIMNKFGNIKIFKRKN